MKLLKILHWGQSAHGSPIPKIHLSRLQTLPWVIPLFLMWLIPMLGSAQSDSHAFCGTYSSQPPGTDNLDSLLYDRFGNAFNIQTLLLDQSEERKPKSGQQDMSGGYFHTTEFGAPPNEVMTVVNQVLTDLSGIIRQRTGQTDCGALAPMDVELQVVWMDFLNPDTDLQAQLGLGDLPPAGAGIGTPFYSGPVDWSCHEVLLDRPFVKINGGRPEPLNAVDGRLILNSNLISTQNCPNVTWNTDPTSLNFPCRMDLYTVVLHEMMHILGYASRIAFDDAFSLWDQSLRLVDDYVPGGGGANPQKVITSNCIRNCWTPMAGFEQLGANTCDPQNPGPDIVLGDPAWAPIAGDPNVDVMNDNAVNNMFSHLSQNCSGQNVQYVMRPGLGTNEHQRTITDPELNIFCELGYQIVSPTVNCTGCYNIANQDRDYVEETACCFKTFHACRGETITVLNSELLCNDITSGGNQTVTAVWPISNPFSGLVTPNAAGDGWNIVANLGPATEFHYTTVGCDCKMHNGRFMIFVDRQCPDCTFTEDVCDNLLCDGDFEDFTHTGSEESRFDYPLFFEGADVSGSPDVIHDGTSNHYAHMGDYTNREAINLPLQTCVSPGCDLILELDYSGSSSAARFEIWGSKNRPCPATVVGAVPLNNNCGTTTVCNPLEDFSPICIANLQVHNNWMSNANPNFEHLGPFTWSNTTDQDVCFLTFVPANDGRIYFDNVVALLECEPEITCNTTPMEICAGTNVPTTLTWTVCAENLPGANSTTVVVNITLPAGITAVDPGQLTQIMTIPEGECVDITLDVLSSLPVGTVVEATISGMASGICTKVDFTCTVPITVVQCDPPLCECTVPGSLNIDAGNGTSVSETDIDPNTVMAPGGYRRLVVPCLSIRGHLLIDDFYRLEIDADEIIMNPGSEITVVTYSQLDIINANQNGGMHGCDVMWRGITVEPRARLLLNNNIIQDAQFVASAFRNATQLPKLRINNTVFNRNHVGIRILDAAGIFTNIPQEGLFTGNTFSCTSNMLPTFDVIANYQNNAPFAGIELHNARFNVGGTGNMVINNAFNNLRNGIAAERSEVLVYGARFTQIVGGGPLNWNGFPIYEFEPATFDGSAGIGILNQRGLNTNVEYSVFDQMYKGVNASVSHIDLLENNLDNVTIGFDIVNADNRNVVIEHNEIGFRQNGIRNTFSNAPLELTINENENIHLIPYTPDPNFVDNKAGIVSQGAGGALLPEGSSISYNTVNLPGHAHGIQVSGNGNMDLFTNQVNFQGLQDEVHNAGFIGIAVWNSRLNYLNGNIILSDNISKHPWGLGSAAHESAIYCCNITHSTFAGFVLSGWCDQSRIRQTTLDNIHTGLSCQNGTVIGAQINAGNLWNAGYANIGAVHGGSQGEINQSLFRVQLPMTDPLWPNQRQPLFGWFNPASGSSAADCAVDAECPQVPEPPEYGPGEGGDIRGSDITLVNGGFSDADYNSMLSYEGGRSLYRRINAYPQMLGQIDVIDNFYYGMAESGLAPLYETDIALATLIPYSVDLKTSIEELQTVIQTMYDEADVLQAQLNTTTDPSEYNSLAAQLETLSENLAGKIGALIDLEATALEIRSNQSDALLAGMGAISETLTLPENNRKTVERLFLESIGKGRYSLTQSQRDELMEVANQCPATGGNAVYEARTLVGLGSAAYHFFDDQLCGGSERKSERATKEEPEQHLQLMPNPAKDQVTVLVPEALQKGSVGVRITDLTGKVWLENIPVSDQASIQLNVGRLPAGVYACQLIPESGKILTETLVLIR
jgi:hypothetical protein